MELFQPRSCNLCFNEMPLEDLRQCSNCGQKGAVPHTFCIYTCGVNGCRTRNCAEPDHLTCWEGHLPRLKSGWQLHEQIDPLPALYVDAVTHSEADMSKQRKLHEEDQIAQWFVVKHDNSGHNMPRLCRTDRFRDLCNPGISDNSYIASQFPGFVSFIGDTGVGKSTLLRAMILMGLIESDSSLLDPSDDNGKSQIADKIESMRGMLETAATCPVTRAENIDNLLNPTSYGVHLYRDYSMSSSHNSGATEDVHRGEMLLFADCEGFRAGYQKTHAENAENNTRKSSPEQSLYTASAGNGNYVKPEKCAQSKEPLSLMPHVSSRSQLTSEQFITAPSYSEHGKEGVEVFYARFLYTISDVIVFVVNSDQSLLTDLQRLIEWASEAVNRSVNGTPYKTLIIVRNMSGFHDEAFYNTSRLKVSMLENMNPLWEGSPKLQRFRNDFNAHYRTRARQIHDNKDLFDVFFQSVEVFYIPDKARAPPGQLYEQYRQLRARILLASQHSQRKRSLAWMQYNTPTLSAILHRAFEHFRTSDRPFDFYKAARNDNPNPTTMPGHMANLLRHFQDVPSYPIDMISEVVATHLVTWAFRHSDTVVDPDEMFQRDLRQFCLQGFEMFQSKDQDCGFVFPNTNNVCVLKMASHADEHCDIEGERCEGDFVDVRILREFTIDKIHGHFVKIYTGLCQPGTRAQMLPSAQNYRQTRVDALSQFKIFWKSIKSNKTCLGCLQALPDHILPCGHSYCDDCVKELGHPSESQECTWIIGPCALCRDDTTANSTSISMLPKCAGVRVLTLDGGGVRGIVELTLLEKLGQTLGLGCRLRDYFDLIVGTSTGGIIALGIASNDMNISEMKSDFFKFATTAFEYGRGGKVSMTLDPWRIMSKIFMIMRLFSSLYPSTPLKSSLIKLFGEDKYLFSSVQRSVRVAVTSVKDNGLSFCFIGNYNRADGVNARDFEREDDGAKEMKIYEAGLATSAAPFYFRPFEKPETKKDYIDGALVANMPVPFALDEVNRIWTRRRRLDFALSVGTGVQNKEIRLPTPLRIGGFEKIYTNFHNNLNSEQTWQRYRQTRSSSELGRIERLNVDLCGSYIALDDYKRMQDMHDQVQEKVKGYQFQRQLRRIKDRMLANLFFFEPDELSHGATYANTATIRGTVRCRLAKDHPALRELLPQVRTFWFGPVREDHAPYVGMSEWCGQADKSKLDKALVDASTRNKFFRMQMTLIKPSDELKCKVMVAVTFKRGNTSGKEEATPISGFPETFERLRERAGYR